MANRESQETMTGLAKRWLKTQLSFHGDPIRSSREQQEAREIEARMEEKSREDAQRAAFEAIIPPSWKRKLSDWEQQAEDRKVQRAEERRAEHAARPRARVTLTLSGDINGSVTADVPVIVHGPVADDPVLLVELEPYDEVSIAGHSIIGLQFAIPEYHGSGSYDLRGIGGDNWTETWDPLWFQFWIDNSDESFFWSPEYGQATVTVDEARRFVAIDMPMHDVSSRSIQLHAELVLPDSENA